MTCKQLGGDSNYKSLVVTHNIVIENIFSRGKPKRNRIAVEKANTTKITFFYATTHSHTLKHRIIMGTLLTRERRQRQQQHRRHCVISNSTPCLELTALLEKEFLFRTSFTPQHRQTLHWNLCNRLRIIIFFFSK